MLKVDMLHTGALRNPEVGELLKIHFRTNPKWRTASQFAIFKSL